MQTVEINGFVIDEFNQHGLKEGASQGTCPLCSHTRKPKNQKAKCASYDWERGLGTCHNCVSTFQLHTYKRKGKAEREYVIPPELNSQKISNKPKDKTLEWFKTRGISEQTLKQVRVGASIDGMGKVVEYQRWPLKWDQAYSNLQKLDNTPKNVMPWLAFTVTAYNIFPGNLF